MASIRQNKVARLLQKEISNILQFHTTEWFPGTMVTVTIVRVAPDFSFAKVYLSVFGNLEPQECIDFLAANNKMVRGELGKKVKNQLRIVPELAFYIDDSLDYAEEIDELLKK
ncbi:MAG: 30S ribosome-binding factor RbfA [Flavobacteriales bacterium]|nr:30S ribosome-binding factor RbfA [Flavobacteriales bacterium]